MVEPRSAEPYFPRWRLGCGGAPGPFSPAERRPEPPIVARPAAKGYGGSRGGVSPVTDVSAQVGHARKSMMLDTYSHVLLSG
jgi:hypothetical protein